MSKQKKVTKQDIESKLREIEVVVEDQTDAAKPAVLSLVTTFLAMLAAVSYAAGARKAKKVKTIIEVKRV